jgi:Uma2 family endonuclease
MSATTIPRSFAEQDAFNRKVWARLVNDPGFRGVLEKIETDRDGNLIMSPPPADPHIVRQNLIAKTLDRLLPEGLWLVNGTVSTPEGVKIPDTVWYGKDRVAARAAAPDELLSRIAPDVCVEVLSPCNTAREIRDKTAAYFAVDVQEVWTCDRDGKMSFFTPQGPLQRSTICPDFPREIPSKVLP